MNLLITGAWREAQKYIKEIEHLGHHVIYVKWEQDVIPVEKNWIEGIICNAFFQYYPIEQFINLCYIQLTSTGFDRVPIKYIDEHNIEIYNAKGVYSIPMAEFAISEVLSNYKHLNDFRAQQEKHEWKKHRDLKELYGKTVVILGCGNVGTECAKRFKAFGCTVIGIDIVQNNNVNFDTIKSIDELDDIIGIADVFLLTLPLTKETNGLINQKRLNRLKNDAILINIARGSIIEQKALQSWNGKAILDVFEEEPLREEAPLWNRPNTIITPHISFTGDGNEKRLAELIIQNLMNRKGKQ